MPSLFVTPPFSPWKPGDAFNQEKEVKYKTKKRGKNNKEVNKPKEKERKTQVFPAFTSLVLFIVTLFVGHFNLGTLETFSLVDINPLFEVHLQNLFNVVREKQLIVRKSPGFSFLPSRVSCWRSNKVLSQYKPCSTLKSNCS